MFEVEQKFKIADPLVIEEALRELGATFHEPIEQVDTYFAHPTRDFSESDEALRMRQVGERNFITYKGSKIDATTKTRREIELPLEPGRAHAEQFSELLQAVGFTPAGVVRKTRRGATLPYGGWSFEVAMDDVAGLGAFVELETIANEAQLDSARASLHALADNLSLTGVERRSYLEMLLSAGESV